MHAWVGWVIAAAALLTALGVFWKAGTAVARWARRVTDFFDDWSGEPARAGVPARPGVMARLETMEGRLLTIEHELHPNSGASLRDAVDRIHEATVDGDTLR
ncbi:hypothetical protein [Actinophytocola sediminis]